MFFMGNDKAEWIIGREEVCVCPLPVYSDLAIAFLDELSTMLRRNSGKDYPDVVSLAFWCRKGNILKWKQQAGEISRKLGRGLIFHITPSNVPVNFAFSFFFGLLSGNANIVRLPSKDYPQIQMICEAVGKLLEKKEYEIINKGTAFVKYGHDKELTDRLSAKADGRIIWGGDRTIREIRQSCMKPKSVELVFADRYSLGILQAETVMDMEENEIRQLAKHFYNDTYLMDQNACSAPHLILWLGEKTQDAKKRFWDAVYEESRRYDLEPIKAVDKYTDFCMRLMGEDVKIRECMQWGNWLYTIEVEKLPERIWDLRGRFGMFYQFDLQELDDLTPFVDERIQTLLYFGVEKQELLEWVVGGHLTGIDRIVPFGTSLDMGVYWDGYDIVGQLSRQVEVR